MTNVLVKKILLLAFMLTMMGMASAQSIIYNSTFDLSSGISYDDNLLIGTEVSQPREMVFNPDGTKMFVLGDGEVNEYSLDTPFRVDVDVTHNGSFSVTNEESNSYGLAFSTDGMKMFILGFTGVSVIEYDLTNSFDITTGVSASGNTYNVSSVQSSVRGLTFSPAGDKMYIYGVNFPNDIDQFDLSTPFDISSTVTYEGAATLATSTSIAQSMKFSTDGTKFFTLTAFTDRIESYTVSTPFDLTSTVTKDEVELDATINDSGPTSIAFNAAGDKLFILGDQGNEVNQYILNPGVLTEASANDGTISSSATITIADETFTNAGSTLTLTTDYTISGIPSGLTPTLTVASDGASASLTLSGTASAHQDANDVANLVFTFNNSAFTGGNAANVTNSSSASSGISINFNENRPVIAYGNGFDVLGDKFLTESLEIGNEQTGPLGITFSADGLTMFVAGNVDPEINQYSLTKAFYISTATLDGSPLDVSSESSQPTDINFSTDGTKMFILDQGGRSIFQYTLSTPWDLNGTVTYDGSPYNVLSEENSPYGMTFNPDGTKMYIVGFTGDEVNQYSLSTPFDITSGVTFDGSPFSVLSETSFPFDIQFNTLGTKMYILNGSTDRIQVYSLNTSFDITAGATSEGNAFLSGVDGTVRDFVFSPAGDRVFILGDAEDRIQQYNLGNSPSLIETVAGDGSSNGSITGSIDIYLVDDQFTNAGSTLSYGSNYTISNLPSGLVPTMSVAGDGLSATVTFAGAATNHQNINDVDGLTFTFENSAFAGGDASKVINGTNANSRVKIDFIDDNPAISYRSIFDLTSNPEFEALQDVSNEESSPQDVIFGADGLKVYVHGLFGSIQQYALTSAYDLRSGITHEGSYSGPSSHRAIAFNDDGSKFYIIGSLVRQYSLSSNFDITSTVTQEATFDISILAPSAYGFCFSPDGMMMFIGANEEVLQFTLSSPYDLSSTVTYTGTSSGVGFVYDISISNDGKNLIILNGDREVDTYYLESAFDITSPMIKGNSSFDVSGIDGNMTGVEFSENGDRVFLTGRDSDKIIQYALSNTSVLHESNSNNGSFAYGSLGFRLTSETFTNAGGLLSSPTHFNISNLPAGLIPSLDITTDGKSARLVLSGNASGNQDASDVSDLIFTFKDAAFTGGDASTVTNSIASNSGISLDFRDGSASITYEPELVNSFEESFDDDGSILGVFTLSIVDDSFTNAGGTLTHGADFTVSGLSAGLTPVLNVAEDGWSAELSLSGNATSNDITDNVADLVFTFNNSAFGNGNASAVANASSASSGYGIVFKELQSVMYSAEGYDISDLTFINSFSTTSETDTPVGLAFNTDGTKLFVTTYNQDVIIQYSLSSPYNVTTGVTLDGTFDVSSEEGSPYDITFNNDGSKVYIAGPISDKVHQYSLSTPFDITSTVTLEGNFSITNVVSVAFSSDGTRMFTTSTSTGINQYTLSTPYDITGTVTLVGNSGFGAGFRSPFFSPDGKVLIVLASSSDAFAKYDLENAFDVTKGVTVDNTFSVSAQETAPQGMTISADGTRFFVSGTIGDDINQYELTTPVFTEAAANDGSVVGSRSFKLIGDLFTNADGTLTVGDDYTISGIPSGLTSSIAVSADGRTATLSLSGAATAHQDTDDVTANIALSFLDGTFISGAASSVLNTDADLSIDLDFDNNGSITYTPTVFYETFENEGEVEGAMLIQIVNETFSNAGSTLTEGEDYSIANIPAGLIPEIVVAANGLSATLTFSGLADNHQEANDLADLIFTFENSAFTTSDATYVFNAVTASSGSSINFDDNNPRVTYGNRFDLSDYPSYTPSVTYDFSAMEDSPGSFAFSNDGMKMFLVGYTNDEVFEYHLTSAFDISDVTYSGNSYALAEVSSPSDLVFDADGTTMFVMEGSGDEIEQYSLTSAFDLSSTVTHQGTFEVSSQDIQPSAMTFSPNGKKMYMVGSFNDKVFQYSLDNPFDLTSGASYDGVEVAISALNYTDIEITEDGETLFISNSAFPGASYIRQYSLNTPFDISDGISITGGFNFHDIDYGPSGYVLSPDNKRLIVLGGNKDLIYQFDLPIDGFSEISLNNGEVEGSLYIEIDDDIFANAGSTMTYGSDYFIDNLQSGLSASMSVAADGYSATVSLSGAALNHQDADDTELIFTFNNSAFVNSNAADVQNAIGTSSARKIDYRDNNPALSYGNTLDMDYASLAGTLDVSNWGDYTTGVIFSNDGLKMFLSVYGTGSVYQYSLTEAYDITTGVSYIGAYDHSAEDEYGEDLAFSTDGTRFYILGNDTYTVYQYNLSTPFDITSGVSYSGNSFNHEDFDTSVYGFTISIDGTKMYIAGTNDYEIFQFSLSTAFDISSASFDGDPLTVEDVSVTGIKFSSDGRYILMTEDNDYSTARYKLFVPWDVTKGGVFQESFDLDAINVWPSGLGISPDGSHVYIVDGDNYAIQQYNINLGDFTETVANDGTVEGSTNIYLIDDEFSNAGGTLMHGADYTINNLPSGLTPTLTVDADGYFASLSLSGSVASHGDADDLPSLQFTFNNSAFSNYDAVDVGNSSNYNAGFGIDYTPYTDNDIVSFSFGEIDGTATIDDGAHTVVAEAIAGTDISAITPAIGISPNAAISPETGIEQDFSSAVTYTVSAEDGTPQDWEVTITEEEVAPTDIILTSTNVDENSAPGTIVAGLSTLDANFNESFTYFVVAVLENDDWQSFDIDGSNLITTNFTLLDFETKNEFTFELEVRDSENEAYSEMVTITLDDVNEAPTDIILSNLTINESIAVGSIVGGLSPEDEDQADTHSYSLKEGNIDNESFDINGDQLVTAEVLDFETKDTYNLEIIVTDQGGLTFEQEFAISVTDLPAQITSIELDNTAIDENENGGTVVGTFSTFGEDLSGSYTYDLASGTGSDDNASFSVSTNQLLTSASFNFETQDSYSIRVMVDDGTLTYESVFNISVNDVSEAPTDLSLITSTIAENNTIGEVIGTLSTTDEDAGESFTYNLVSGEGGTDNASFDIIGNELQAGEVFDFETQDSYSIRIETNDGNGGTFSKSFTVSITNENESILVLNPIADQDLDEGFTSLEIDLSEVFTDQDGDALTYEVSSDDETIVTVSNSEALLTITEVGNFGSSTVTITADDGSGVTTSDDFIVTVSNINDAPIVANVISDQDVNEGFGSLEIDLSSTFSDEDGDALTLEASSGDETVATASITGTTLTISEIGNGSATITVTANDGNGGTVQDEFLVTVNNINDAPIVASAIANQNLNEGFESIDIDITETFTDEDGDVLTYSVSSNDETVVTISELNGILTIVEVGMGTSTITVTANDGNGGSVSDEFTVTVDNVNDAPVVVNPLDDQTAVEEGFGAAQFSYAEVFEDADGDALTITVTSSNESVVTAEVIANDQIQINEVGIGTSTITLTADDGNGGTVSDEFIFTVNEATNNAPIVVNPLDDQTSIIEGFGAAQFSYADVFEDEDSDALTITVSSSDESVVTVEVISNDQIQVNEVGLGTSTITITADDGNGGTVSDEFIFTVNEAANNSPVLANETADQNLNEGFGSVEIDLSNTFSDEDGDALTFIVTSSDESVVTISESNAILTVTEVGLGTSTITVTANDGNGGTASDEFTFTVNEEALGLKNLEVKIYPNPSTDFIYVESTEELSVRLTDLNGKEIQTKSGSQLEFDVQSLSSGLYILQVSDGDRSSNYRVIKAK